MRSRTELLLLVACCGFLLFYGLGAFGLLGADEPRYAQVAREMLDRGDLITPTLNGKPWLEKPPLYYWQAMLAYRSARTFGSGNDGVSEQTTANCQANRAGERRGRVDKFVGDERRDSGATGCGELGNRQTVANACGE